MLRTRAYTRTNNTEGVVETVSSTLAVTGARLDELPDGLPHLRIEPRVSDGLEVITAQDTVAGGLGAIDVSKLRIKLKVNGGLSFDANGALQTTGTGGVATTAPATAGKLAKFTGNPLTLTDSMVSDNGTTVTIAGAVSTSGSAPLLNLTQTWNAAAVLMTAIKLDVTNTASLTGSRLLDLQVAAVSAFHVTRDGDLQIQTPTTAAREATATVRGYGDTLQYASMRWANTQNSKLWSAAYRVSGDTFSFLYYNGTSYSAAYAIEPPSSQMSMVVYGRLGLGAANASSAYVTTDVWLSRLGAGQLGVLGHILPTATATYDLGAASARMRNVYANTLSARAAANQDGLLLAGRAGGTSNYTLTLRPTTLTADGETVLVPGTMITTVNGSLTINGTAGEVQVTGSATQSLGSTPAWTIGLPDDVDITTTLDVGNVTGITAATMRVGGNVRVGGTIYANDFVLTGGAGSGVGITLNNLDDVSITGTGAALTGHYLRHNGGAWINQTIPSADLGSGTASSTTYLRGDRQWVSIANVSALNDLSDVVIAASPPTGHVVRFDGTNWVNAALASSDLGSGTANSTTFLRGDRTWAALTAANIGSGTFSGTYSFTNGINGNARVGVRNNGTLVGTRRAINLIPGSGISYTITDDPTNEEVEITITSTASGGVSSFNTRTGAVTLSSSDVTTALGFTPYNSTNPNGYITSAGSISGNAATATTLQTARTINGTSFNGSANITTASWGTARTLGFSGDATGSSSVDGSVNVTTALTLSNSGVTAGTYNDSATAVRPFTVDAKGRVTAVGTAVTITPSWANISAKPTTLSGFGITDAATASHTHTSFGTMNFTGEVTRGTLNYKIAGILYSTTDVTAGAAVPTGTPDGALHVVYV